MSEYYQKINITQDTRTNRYKDCPVYREVTSGDIVVATRELLTIPSKSTDYYHRVKQHEITRLDTLAHLYYRNPLLWWVIAEANDISDPFIELTPGVILRIPTIETLYGNEGILL